ncbi:hypothetical protein [uncultured Campylobacter sp.]|uniref:hypothetical protein n=1 Tax=uncultured Campylobacter sp. TaxID=218934 RepID=UPI0026256973|nr:hypothetical protein [uncultured Campylobacter sp.]
MGDENSEFSGSCEDAESLNLSEQSSNCELNLSDENSAATLNLNDQNLSNQSFAAIGIASMSNLDGENSATGVAALNFKNKNSAMTDIIATSKTMVGTAKTGSYNERRRSKNDKNSAKQY